VSISPSAVIMIPSVHESIKPIREKIENSDRSVISIHINTEQKMVCCLISVVLGDE